MLIYKHILGTLTSVTRSGVRGVADNGNKTKTHVSVENIPVRNSRIILTTVTRTSLSSGCPELNWIDRNFSSKAPDVSPYPGGRPLSELKMDSTLRLLVFSTETNLLINLDVVFL